MRIILKNKAKTILLSSIFIMSTSISVSAHKGQEDENGGHKNILGKYHYHHGYDEHLHEGGICQYLVNKGKKDGEKDGRENGYSDLINSDYTYDTKDSKLSVYQMSYVEEYNKSYKNAFREAQNELKLAEDNGYNMGLKGEIKNTEDYEHQLLKTAYETKYKVGYDEYKKEQVKIYEDNGREHGYKGTGKIDYENIPEEYKNAYDDGYDDGVGKRKLEKRDEGKKAALNNSPKNESYEGDNLTWYEEGYQDGKNLVGEIKSYALNQGKNGKDKEIPEEFLPYESIFTESYELGLQAREKNIKDKEDSEKRKKGIKLALICVMATTIIIPVGIIIKNKSKKNDICEEDKDIVA